MNSLYGVECGLPARLDAPNHSISFDADTIAAALVNIYQKKYGNGREIEPTLFEKTKEIFNNAVSKGWNAGGSPAVKRNSAFVDALKHNTDVFSAFRVHKMQSDIAAQLLDEKGNLKPFGKFVKDVKPYISHQNRAWLETEYNTAVLRAHQAADWKQFEAEKDVLPNLEWQPSTSPNPGEDHKPYWFTVLPVDHKFWTQHRPGDRWNCKCNLRNTDKPATAVPTETLVKNLQPSKGLDTNPGTTGEIFSNSHPYYPENCGKCPFNKGVGRLFANLIKAGKDCSHCNLMDKCIAKTNECIKENKEKTNNWRKFSPVPKYAINEEKYKDLCANYNTKVSLKDIQNTSLERFDAVRLLRIIESGIQAINNSDIAEAWKHTKRSIIKMEKENAIILKISGEKFRLLLSFGTDRMMVINKLINIEPNESGLGSVISLELLKQYTTMGITKIIADPNLSAGGYTWARTGYFASNREIAENVVKTRFKKQDLECAMQVIERYYSKGKKNDKEPFPMQKIAHRKYKSYLVGSSWLAELNPQTYQKKGMIRYLERKIKQKCSEGK